MHFLAGGVLLLLGGVQLVSSIRARWPAAHRWIGRVYVTAAFLAGVGGLGFIASKGTVGGWPMTVGFTLYGVLVVLASVQAYRYAHARMLVQHRAWALRLFALAIGSWLYRMEYGFWRVLTNTAGHTRDFTGPFDAFMSFFFYLPNLLVVEAFLRARGTQAGPLARWSATALASAAAAFVALATWFFWKRYWGPPILRRPDRILGGIVFDTAALVLLNRRLHRVPAHTPHLVERVGLLTIIMLGESVISISAALAGIAWNASNVTAAISGFVMVSAIWWIYYDSDAGGRPTTP